VEFDQNFAIKSSGIALNGSNISWITCEYYSLGKELGNPPKNYILNLVFLEGLQWQSCCYEDVGAEGLSYWLDLLL